MAADPSFANTPNVGLAQVSAANTNRDGTGTIVTVLTGGANGTIIDFVRVVATGTTTAGVIRLFLYDGANTRLLEEIIVPAITPSTTLKVFERTLSYLISKLLIPNGWELRASTHNAETFNVVASGANL